MNERNKELREQAWTAVFNEERTHGEQYETLEHWEKCDQTFADLIRADEREALEKIDWTAVMREGSLVTWADAQELGDRVLAAIRARGNT